MSAKSLNLNRTCVPQESVVMLDELDSENRERDRSWFWDLLSSVLESPDLDYSQFVQIESKKTARQMRRNGFY